jgi:quercetin dioxygenase-like cupin family protein
MASMKRILCSLLVATLPLSSVLADAPKSKNAKVTLVYQHELPNVPGKSIKGVLVEYGPGGYSPGHTHPKSAFIYATVLEGAIRSQVNDGPVTTYKAGQSFSELPGDRHVVSANASKTKPAKLLAVFVVDTNETITTSLPQRRMSPACRLLLSRPGTEPNTRTTVLTLEH